MVAPAVLTDRGRFFLPGRPRQGHLQLDLCEFGGAVRIAASGLPLPSPSGKSYGGGRGWGYGAPGTRGQGHRRPVCGGEGAQRPNRRRGGAGSPVATLQGGGGPAVKPPRGRDRVTRGRSAGGGGVGVDVVATTTSAPLSGSKRVVWDGGAVHRRQERSVGGPPKSAMGGARGISVSHTKSVAYETRLVTTTAERSPSAPKSSEGIWRGKDGLGVGLKWLTTPIQAPPPPPCSHGV